MPSKAQATVLAGPRDGDESESREQILERLFREYFVSIQAYFKRQGFSPDEASDLAQETFLRAWRGIETFREASSHSTWLFKIARNILLNVWRDRKAGKRDGATLSLDVESDGDEAIQVIEVLSKDNPELKVLDDEEKKLLHREIEKLPQQMSNCLQLRLGDMKYREIAEILGVSIETVKSHLHQAKQRLTIALGGIFEVDFDAGQAEEP